MSAAYAVLWGTLAFGVYTYAGYPLLLQLLGLVRRPRPVPPPPARWPLVTVTIPVYNEEAVIRGKLEAVLASDYPPERRQILVVSDASTDRTDAIVKEFAHRGVELIRLPQRRGKTAVENAAVPHSQGEIIVNSDASIREPPSALKALIVRFGDPTVGVASGRDVSVTTEEGEANQGESGYVGYEMRVRRLETNVAGIVGASGCCYAIRAQLHVHPVPEGLSRDFAAPLTARQHGYRAVSVDEAVVYVPRIASLRREYRRKVRTMTRGMETFFYKGALLNPLRYGLYAWQLFSHKLCRWLLPVAGVLGLGALVALARVQPWARWALAAAGLVAGLAVLGWVWPEGRRLPRILSLPAYLVAGNVAVLHSWINVLRGARNAIWEPTRRPTRPPAS
jgi:cellulose synthase/poly-beta-1,6-N-acetylglucosamine synthase-like glycosyltransferase